MSQIIFEVTQEPDGGYTAEALGESIFTEADSWDELRRNVADAVGGYFFDTDKPSQIRLRLIRDELMAVG